MTLQKLIVALMLIALVTACSESEKVYSLKTCESKSIDSDNCDKCKISQEVKVKYKVNKSTSSVLQTIIQRDGTSKTTTIDGCTILDDESFECSREERGCGGIETPYFSTMKNDLYLSDDKWEQTYSLNILQGSPNKQDDVHKHTYSCGTEIVSISNLFK